MKNLFIAVGIFMLAVSMSVQSQEGLYIGPSLSYYYLDSDRVVSGHDEAGVLSFNIGYRFSNDWALEASHGTDVAGEDIDVSQLSAYYWFGEDDGGWRTYAVGGYAYYDREGEKNLQIEEEYTHQLQAGLGMSNMITPQLEFRGDVRLLNKVRGEGKGSMWDSSVNFGLRYYFNKPAEPIVEQPVVVREPEMAPETRTLTVKLNVEFEFDKADVRAIYGDELEAVANAMKVHEDITLELEGHTDSRGKEGYNQDLSLRRVEAVKAKIQEEYGIDASRITTTGYGESRPIADNDTDDGRARNRRVVGEMTFTEVVK
jgi:OOP family OmpA-OmpF porin|tara:strand:+ start:149 stop:1093 length:945 start_codon:yes stop_codon:yes gene_type:complete